VILLSIILYSRVEIITDGASCLESKKDTNKMVEDMVLSIRFKFRINMPLDSNNTTNQNKLQVEIESLLEEMRKIDPYG
jgi:hypothetical protein